MTGKKNVILNLIQDLLFYQTICYPRGGISGSGHQSNKFRLLERVVQSTIVVELKVLQQNTNKSRFPSAREWHNLIVFVILNSIQDLLFSSNYLSSSRRRGSTNPASSDCWDDSESYHSFSLHLSSRMKWEIAYNSSSVTNFSRRDFSLSFEMTEYKNTPSTKKFTFYHFSSPTQTPCPIRASFCDLLTIWSIWSSRRLRIASIDHAIVRSFFLVTGPIPGISSSRFFFISFVRFDRLNVIAKRCASSRIFWNTRSSLEATSNRIDSLWYGRKTSSSRFANEHIWGLTPWRFNISSSECHSDNNSHRICSLPFSIPSRAAESCHLPPSMIMRWGKFDSFTHST